MWNSLNVNGFSFDSSEEYNEAKKEAEAINYICAKMDVTNPQIALKVYYKLLERKNLHTIIGFTFLKELRDTIIEAKIIEPKNLKPIQTTIAFTRPKKNIDEYGDEEALNSDATISSEAITVDPSIPVSSEDDAATHQALEKKREEGYYKKREQNLRSIISSLSSRIKKCYFVICMLILIIIALFGISLYNSSLDLSAKEIELQDKYAAWSEQLMEKEAELTQREALLGK